MNYDNHHNDNNKNGQGFHNFEKIVLAELLKKASDSALAEGYL